MAKSKKSKFNEEINVDVETSDLVDESIKDSEIVESMRVTGHVTTDVLNIRENFSGDSDTPIVARVKSGEEIAVYPEESNSIFYKVRTSNGIEGYAMRRYILLSDDE